MPSISVPATAVAAGAASAAGGSGALIAAGVGAAGALGSALISSSAAGDAADAQRQGLDKAIQSQYDFYNRNQGMLQPWITGGQGAFNQLQGLTGTNPGGNPMTAQLTRPFQPTMAELSQTPGYQFALQQGLKGVQNSAAAKGLGTSGEALAGAANYATGLASTTYQQQFQNYMSQNAQIANMLGQQSGQGVTAAGALTGQGLQTGQNIGNAQIGQGNADANASLASGGAFGGAVNSSLNNLASMYYLQSLRQQQQTPQNQTGGGAFPQSLSGNQLLPYDPRIPNY